MAGLTYSMLGGKKGILIIGICIMLFLTFYNPSSGGSSSSSIDPIKTNYYDYQSSISVDDYNWSNSVLSKQIDPNTYSQVNQITNSGNFSQRVVIRDNNTKGVILDARSWISGSTIYAEWEDHGNNNSNVYEYWKSGSYKTLVVSDEVYPTPPKPLNEKVETGSKTRKEALLVSDPVGGAGYSGVFEATKVMQDGRYIQYRKDDGTTIIYSAGPSSATPVYYEGYGKMNGEEVVIVWAIYDIGETSLPSNRKISSTTVNRGSGGTP